MADPTLIRLDAHTWIFEEEGVRFFLLEGTESALLIDSGMFTRNARDLAQQVTDRPLMLLNTHADCDHVGSNAQFDKFYMNLAEASNYYNNFKGCGSIIPIRGGDTIDLGGRMLEIIDLPGHTPGGIAVLDCAAKRLFSGDPVQKNGDIFMFGEQREMHAYIASLRQLESRAGEFDRIYPSHGEYPLWTDAIHICREDAEKILEGKISGKPFKVFGNKEVTLYDAGFTRFLCEP